VLFRSKQIHENDKVIFVKARQIGMTTLLAGYVKWVNNSLYSYNGITNMEDSHFKKIFRSFSNEKKIINDKYHYMFDEHNYKQIPLPYTPIKDCEKLIIAGTPDPEGNLKWVVDRKDELGFKVFTYTANDCYPKWTKRGMMQFVSSPDIDKYIAREVHCKFV
jgi:hypothetical protein